MQKWIWTKKSDIEYNKCEVKSWTNCFSKLSKNPVVKLQAGSVLLDFYYMYHKYCTRYIIILYTFIKIFQQNFSNQFEFVYNTEHI